MSAGAFAGQTALVIGGSSGMGQGAARALAAGGAEVVVTSRSQDRIDKAVADANAARGVVCDLADLDSVRAAVDGLDRLDHLVVTAAPAQGGTDREFFDGKFWGTRTAAEAAASKLGDDGTMTFASGGMSVRPAPGAWSVSCAFAAVEALARALAVELAPVRVNCIRPGLFDTNTWSGMDPDERERFIAEQTTALPAGRAGTPEDFGDALVGILGARYLTGQIIDVDGGVSLLGN